MIGTESIIIITRVFYVFVLDGACEKKSPWIHTRHAVTNVIVTWIGIHRFSSATITTTTTTLSTIKTTSSLWPVDQCKSEYKSQEKKTSKRHIVKFGLALYRYNYSSSSSSWPSSSSLSFLVFLTILNWHGILNRSKLSEK